MANLNGDLRAANSYPNRDLVSSVPIFATEELRESARKIALEPGTPTNKIGNKLMRNVFLERL
jgi:hypothetical protein